MLRDPTGCWGTIPRKCSVWPFVCTWHKELAPFLLGGESRSPSTALLRPGCIPGAPTHSNRRGHFRSPQPWGQGSRQETISTHACPQQCPGSWPAAPPLPGLLIPFEAQLGETCPGTHAALPSREEVIPAQRQSDADLPATRHLHLHWRGTRFGHLGFRCPTVWLDPAWAVPGPSPVSHLFTPPCVLGGPDSPWPKVSSCSSPPLPAKGRQSKRTQEPSPAPTCVRGVHPAPGLRAAAAMSLYLHWEEERTHVRVPVSKGHYIHISRKSLTTHIN